MAITKTPEQAAYDAFNALLVADTAASNGLANVTKDVNTYTSNAVLLGNYDAQATPTFRLLRRGDPKRSPMLPRMEAEITTAMRRDTTGRARVEALVRLFIITDRNIPNGFTRQEQVALRARTVFARVTPATTGGWAFSPIHEVRPFQGPATETLQQLVVEYQVILSASGEF